MSDDEFEDTELELDEDLAEDAIEDLDEDLPIDGEEGDEEVVVVVEADPVAALEDAVAPPPKSRTRVKSKVDDDEEDVVDLDEELHPDDVEEPLDVLLAERTASGALTDEAAEQEEEEVEVDDRAEGSTRIVPRRANEFLCQSCFLVLPMNQLADEKRMLCRDCV